MQTSNKIRKILVLPITIILTIVGIWGLKYCFTSPSLTELFNHHVDELIENGENVDMVFVGASRMYYGFDPSVFEEELGMEHVLNDGTPAQRSVLSYYMLKDMIEKFQPKYVVFGTTYNGLMFDQGMQNFTFAMDRLSLHNRIACATNVFGTINGLMILTGKSEYLKEENFDNIRNHIIRRFRRSRGIYDREQPKYYENGYVANYRSMEQGSIDYGYDEDRAFYVEDIDAKALEYLKKSIQLCQDNGIEMILISGMCTTARMYSVDNYQTVTEYFTDLAEDYGIHYINMNYLRNREELFPDSVFIDDQHLNNIGGQVQSKIFAGILKDMLAGKDCSHYFYSNFEEMSQDVHRIPGCTAAAIITGDKINLDCRSVHNPDVVPEYRITAINEENESEYLLTDWTEDSNFNYSKKLRMKYDYLLVEARSGEPGETYAFHKIKLDEVA